MTNFILSIAHTSVSIYDNGDVHSIETHNDFSAGKFDGSVAMFETRERAKEVWEMRKAFLINQYKKNGHKIVESDLGDSFRVIYTIGTKFERLFKADIVQVGY